MIQLPNTTVKIEIDLTKNEVEKRIIKTHQHWFRVIKVEHTSSTDQYFCSEVYFDLKEGDIINTFFPLLGSELTYKLKALSNDDTTILYITTESLDRGSNSILEVIFLIITCGIYFSDFSLYFKLGLTPLILLIFFSSIFIKRIRLNYLISYLITNRFNDVRVKLINIKLA